MMKGGNECEKISSRTLFKKIYCTCGRVIQWSMTLTDMKLTEYMGFTEKSATAEPFI